jgi:multiple sugar transport system permease protein
MSVGIAERPLGTTPAPPDRARARRRREIAHAYLLLAPTLVLLAAVLVYPLAWELWASFTDYSAREGASAAFVGLRNYTTQFGEREFWIAATVTVGYTVVTTLAKIALGLAFALLLARPFRGRALVFLAIFLPWAYPASVSVIGWFWTLNPPIPTAYSPFMGHLKYVVDGAMGDGAWAFVSVTLFNVWRGSSFIGVLLLAGLNAIPAELFEYAALECRSAGQRFWGVTVPLLKPFLALGMFLSLTSAFTDLTNVWMLTAGRIVFPVIGTRAYWLAIHDGQFGLACARSLTLVPFLVVVLLIFFRLFDPPERDAA